MLLMCTVAKIHPNNIHTSLNELCDLRLALTAEPNVARILVARHVCPDRVLDVMRK